MRILIIIALGATLAGCQSPEAARKTAGLLATHTHTVRRETESFAKSRTVIDRARQRNINYLEETAVSLEQSNALDIRMWKVSGQGGKSSLHALVLAETKAARKRLDDLADLRRTHEKIALESRHAVRLRSNKLAEAAKALSKLAEARDLKRTVMFYKAFFTEVRSRYGELKQQAEAQAAAGAKAADSSTGAARAEPRPQ